MGRNPGEPEPRTEQIRIVGRHMVAVGRVPPGDHNAIQRVASSRYGLARPRINSWRPRRIKRGWQKVREDVLRIPRVEKVGISYSDIQGQPRRHLPIVL